MNFEIQTSSYFDPEADASSIKLNVVRQIIKDLGLDHQKLQSEGKQKTVEIKEENVGDIEAK